MATVTVSLEGYDELIAKLEKYADARGSVKAGILEGATNDEGTNVLDYAPFLEFGTSGMPARPFMRTTFANHKMEWVNIIANVLKRNGDPEAALVLAGEQMQADIINQIKSNMPPPNSPSWVRYKQKKAPANANNTLMYTTTMIKSIDFKVEP